MSSLPPSPVRPLSRLEADAIIEKIPSLGSLPRFTLRLYVEALADGRSWPEAFLERFELSAIRAEIQALGPRPGGRS
jgi:hypothetical protein